MQAHTDMTKNQRVKCGIIVFSFLIAAFVLASSASAGLAAQTALAEKTIPTPGEAETLAFPFFAEITGDNVLYRSGPGRNFYECGKLNKGDKVKVVRQQFSWYRIVPPPKSFSWISAQFVEKDPGNPGFGKVTGDHVRVYAGSNSVPPHHSASLQGKLNKGERVKLLGQLLDGHYKIAPPAFAFMCVSKNFSKPLAPTAKVEPSDVQTLIKVPAVVKVVPLAGDVPAVVKVLPSGEVPAVVKFDPAVKAVVAAVAPKPKPAPEEIIMLTGTRLEQYRALKAQLKAENLKEADKRDYKAIKKALIEIANDKEAGNPAKFAQKLVMMIKGYELAMAVDEKLRLQKEQLDKKTAGIAETRAAKLAAMKDLGRFAVTGTLQPFTLYGAGHYRIVDESGKMLCYALPSGLASQTDLTSLIGKKVGIVGTIQPHLPTKKAMVRFSEIVLLK
jgi:uncharacterized protein YgiM (DUF1202 family)